MDEAKEESEKVIAELREMRANASKVVKEHELIEAKKIRCRSAAGKSGT